MQKWNTIPLQVKASVAYTVCSILQKCLSFITLPLFTRLLTQEQYGIHNVYSSWYGIFSIFITLNLAYGSFATAMVRFEHERAKYIASIQNVCLVLCGIFLMLYLPFADFWNTFLKLPTGLVCIMVADILTNFSLLCWYGVKRFEFKYKSVVLVTMAIAIATPTLAYILVMNSAEKGYARTIGYAAVGIAVGAFLFVSNAIKGKGGFNKKYWKYALSFNIPLIPYYLSQVIFNQSDQIMINNISGTDKAAMYGVAYSLATLLNFILNAINNSYVPWFYGKIKEGKPEENKSVATGISLLMAFMLMGVIALAPEIILIMAGKEYAPAAWVVPPVAMSILLLFYSQLFINVEFYYEEKNMLVWSSIGAAVLNVVLNALLIPKFGFVAAGYTTLLSYIAFAVTNYFTMKIAVKRRGEVMDAFNLKALIFLFIGFAALAFTAMALYNLHIVRYIIIAIVLLGVAIMHKKVAAFVTSVLKRG